MNRPTRSNPAYAVLAYRKALFSECIAHLMQFTSSMGDDAKTLVSEDLVRADSELPEEQVHEFIVELQQKEHGLELEMSKFDFVKKDSDGSREQKTEKDAGSSAEKRQPTQGRRRSAKKG